MPSRPASNISYIHLINSYTFLSIQKKIFLLVFSRNTQNLKKAVLHISWTESRPYLFSEPKPQVYLPFAVSCQADLTSWLINRQSAPFLHWHLCPSSLLSISLKTDKLLFPHLCSTNLAQTNPTLWKQQKPFFFSKVWVNLTTVTKPLLIIPAVAHSSADPWLYP